MKKFLILLAITQLMISCNGQNNGDHQLENEKLLADFIDLNGIKKAEVSNNYGTFLLNKTQLENLKTALRKLSYEPNQDIKVGAKAVSFTIDEKEYHLAMRTNGEMAELTINGESYVFKTNGLNLDNYQRN